jgi:hypothetical protein
MTAPERIYMKPNDMYENGWARPIDTDQFDEEATEYVRADLAAAQSTQGDYFEGLEEGIKIGRGEPQPDHRNDVIARLVEATEQFLIEYDEVDLAVHEPKSLTDAVYEARAALAAAKAVRR